eukprot:TRINITY_DN882_c0_g1_i1.p1 TRINITY_DN882_c0_g1~~TRINITY_DN882_c0_g1_i1.p1  ORF type:complete len:528 (-),score=96.96 TRINITY_DN882_c0_g1_i1:111-1694(-)
MLSVYVGTWNVAFQTPVLLSKTELLSEPHPLRQLTSVRGSGIDLIVIGLQEIELSPSSLVNWETQVLQKWSTAISQSLSQFPEEYHLLLSHQLSGLGLFVFIQSKHVKDVKQTSVARLTFGKWGMANKGALGCHLVINQSSFAFINVHLAAGKEHENDRNRQIKLLFDNLFFERFKVLDHGKTTADVEEEENICPNQETNKMQNQDHLEVMMKEIGEAAEQQKEYEATTPMKTKLPNEVTINRQSQFFNIPAYRNGRGDGTQWAPFDHQFLFLFGDFNSHLDNFTKEEIEKSISSFELQKLQEEDQLTKYRKNKSHILSYFEEGDVFFPPTFKYDKNTKNYDTSAKRRSPGWTDRILWWENPSPKLRFSPFFENLSPTTVVKSIPPPFVSGDSVAPSISLVSNVFTIEIPSTTTQSTPEANPSSMLPEELLVQHSNNQDAKQRSDDLIEYDSSMRDKNETQENIHSEKTTQGVKSAKISDIQRLPQPAIAISPQEQKQINLLTYNQIENLLTSDHRPVFALFQCSSY